MQEKAIRILSGKKNIDWLTDFNSMLAHPELFYE